MVGAWGVAGVGGAARAQDAGGAESGTRGRAGAGGWIVEAFIFGLALAAVVTLWRLDVVRPGSLVRRGVRAVRGVPWGLYIMAGFLTIAATVVGAAAGVVVPGARGTPSPLRMGVTQSGAAAMSILVGVALVRMLRVRREGGGIEPEGFDLRVRAREVAWAGVVFALAVFPVYQAASIVVSHAVLWVSGSPPPPVAHETLREIVANRGEASAWVLIGGAVVLGPIAEELTFRVFLQSGVLALVRRPWIAIVVTSVLFVLMHLGSGVPWRQAYALAPLFVLSLGLGAAYEWTKRPVAPIVMHMLFNAVNVALAAGAG